jgi:hypothetical protein
MGDSVFCIFGAVHQGGGIDERSRVQKSAGLRQHVYHWVMNVRQRAGLIAPGRASMAPEMRETRPELHHPMIGR